MIEIQPSVERYILSAPLPRLKEMRKAERYQEILDQPGHRDYAMVQTIMARIDREIETRQKMAERHKRTG